MPDEESPWPDGIPPRLRRSARVPRLGTPPAETSATFQVLPTVLSLTVALVLLVWYATLQRHGRVIADLDRLGVIVAGGAAPAGRSVAEGACLEVQRVEAEVAPIVALIGGVGEVVGDPVSAPFAWFDVQTGASLAPWLGAARVRDAATHLCAGVRLAARAVASGGVALPVDVAASQASFNRAIESLGSVPADAVTGLGRVGAHVGTVRTAIAKHRLDAASLVALVISAGPTEAGEGRGATYLLVARAHLPDGSPDAVAIARVTVRDGTIVGHHVNTAPGWDSRGGTTAAPPGLAAQAGDRIWHLADYDWWLDFRNDAAQLLGLWQAAGEDAAVIDGVLALDITAFGEVGVATVDSAAVAHRLDGVLLDAAASRAATGALVSALERAANEGLAVAWMREPAVQAVVEARGWAGAPALLPADQVAVARRALRGPRSHVVEVVGPREAGVRVEGATQRVRLVVAASVPVRSVHGADGLVESTREGDVIVLDVPVGRGGGTVVVPVG